MKIAVVGPNFFSYVQAVTSRLVAKGFPATFFDERHANSVGAKVYYRLGLHKYVSAARDRHLGSVVRSIIEQGFTHVLLINSESIGRKHVIQLRRAGLKTYFFSWDSVRNKPDFVKLRDVVIRIGTFDMVDARRHELTYIPLFADTAFSRRLNDAPADRDIDLSFCGTLHSNRSARLKRVIDSLPRHARISLKIYVHSPLIFMLNALKAPTDLTFRKIVSTVSFTRAEIADMLFRSKYVIDLPHPSQAGLTARTFEALRAGARLVTFNRQATTLPPSLADRLIIVDHPRQAAKLDLGAAPLPPLSAEDDYFLSIDRFVDDLLEMMDIPVERGMLAA
jgi:hypothetical protein